MRGTVTNTTSDPLTDVNVHAVDVVLPDDLGPRDRGLRRVRPRDLHRPADHHRRLLRQRRRPGPRPERRLAVRVPVSELQISGEEGVYWIGVQVLGADETGAREVRGRARSFIPLVRAGRRRCRPR